jgi:hypothetical protein
VKETKERSPLVHDIGDNILVAVVVGDKYTSWASLRTVRLKSFRCVTVNLTNCD